MNAWISRFSCAAVVGWLLLQGLHLQAEGTPSLPWRAGSDEYCIARQEVLLYGKKGPDWRTAQNHLYRFDLATSTLARLLSDETESTFLKYAAQHLDASPDGRFLVFITLAPEIQRGATRILLLDVASGHLRILVSNERNNIFPKFSPDGREVAFYHSSADIEMHKWEPGTKGFALSIINIATSEIRQLALEDWRLYHEGPPSWSPDGKYLAYSGMYGQKGGGEIYVVPTNGAESRRISPPDIAWCREPVWLSNSMILYNASPGLFIVNADGTGNRPLFRGAVSGMPYVSPDGRKICFTGVPLPSSDRQSRLIVLDITGKILPSPHPDVILHKWRR